MGKSLCSTQYRGTIFYYISISKILIFSGSCRIVKMESVGNLEIKGNMNTVKQLQNNELNIETFLHKNPGKNRSTSKNPSMQ